MPSLSPKRGQLNSIPAESERHSRDAPGRSGPHVLGRAEDTDANGTGVNSHTGHQSGPERYGIACRTYEHQARSKHCRTLPPQLRTRSQTPLPGTRPPYLRAPGQPDPSTAAPATPARTKADASKATPRPPHLHCIALNCTKPDPAAATPARRAASH
ncbi:hypothetical protein GCM10009565_28880 [Amycolatopsis albidoflavus]